MDDKYLKILKMRLLWCEEHYEGKHRLAALKNVIWSLGYLIIGKDPREKHRSDYNTNKNIRRTIYSDNLATKTSSTSSQCKIAMISSGGFGDHLLFANYVYCFYQKYSDKCNFCIDVVFKDKFGLANNIFVPGDFVRQVIDFKKYNDELSEYDLVLNLGGFPKIEKINRSNPVISNGAIAKYIEACEEYRNYCRSAFRGNAYGMSKLCEMEGRKLIQRGDIYSILGITEEYSYPLFIREDEEKYLSQLGLDKKAFITVQTGIDVIYQSHVKQWPIAHYRKLVDMIFNNYPSIKIVQVGNSGEISSKERKNFINLVNKTDLEQAKVLMKNSLIHIDIEGGMVHLRHALRGGISIVLFGPTSVDFFGYSNNCNVKSSACNDTCYQLTNCWPEKCPKYGTSKCMESITPEMVFDEFKRLYEGGC